MLHSPEIYLTVATQSSQKRLHPKSWTRGDDNITIEHVTIGNKEIQRSVKVIHFLDVYVYTSGEATGETSVLHTTPHLSQTVFILQKQNIPE